MIKRIWLQGALCGLGTACIAGSVLAQGPVSALPDAGASSIAAAADVVDEHNSADIRSSLRFVVNNTGDRVGAALDLCDRVGPDETLNCGSIVFFFPQLTYDRTSREIKLGAVVLERRAFWPWKRWKNPAYRVAYAAARRTQDQGFDRVPVTVYSAYLEKLPR